MDIITEIRAEMADEWLPNIYATKVRSGRTRSYKIDIPRRENTPQVQYTLLGIEMKVGRKRFACPDLATARYLLVFARLGCGEFAVPYDISLISGLADELETSWQRSLLLLQQKNGERPALVKAMRGEIDTLGPGKPMPLFDRETRQRK